MCGIYGFVSQKRQPIDLVFNGIKTLEYRGYDSWGVITNSGNVFKIKKFLGKISQKPQLPPGTVSLAHTRWATHGGITLENCHPHTDCHQNIALVHNGIVENYLELKGTLLSQGHIFRSQTDTEVIVHLIEEFQKNNPFPESVRLAFARLKGFNAIAVISKIDHRLVVAKNGSPLVIGKSDGINFISSDPISIVKHTNEFYFLKDGELVVIDQNVIQVINISTNQEQTISFETIKNFKIDNTLNAYPNFLLKEINDQPKILEIINKSYNLEELLHIFKKIIKYPQVFFSGCGSSFYAALFNANLLSQKLKKSIICFPSSESGQYLKMFSKNSFLLTFSQSGETIDAINLINQAKKLKAATAALVNVPYSTITRLVDNCQLLPCGTEVCVLSTKTFTAQIGIFLKLLGFDLSLLTSSIKQILSLKYQSNIKKLAQKISQSSHLFVIGRGIYLPIVLETALKIKEVSYIHAEAFAGGELKHGPIALIEGGTPCLILAPTDANYDNNISNALELKARGALIIGLSSKPHPVFDYYFPISDFSDQSALIYTIFAQLLAYYLCLERGYDPDKPRNLAKCVTVK